MTQQDENTSDNIEAEIPEEAPQEKVVKIPVKPQRFTPPIHGNKFAGGGNFGGNKQRPGRAAQRGR